MAEELGQVEKPSVEEFKEGRKLYFIPLVYSGKDSPDDYLNLSNRYWNQVEDQLGAMDLKLGRVNRVYHELIPESGEEAVKLIKEMNEKSYEVVRNRLDKGAELESTEDNDLLTELVDWSRCLAIGLQNQRVMNQVYDSYTAVSKKRNEQIAVNIDKTLKEDEIGVLFWRERHQVQFPKDIQVIYVSPPALDEINRWLRDREAQRQKPGQEGEVEKAKKTGEKSEPEAEEKEPTTEETKEKEE
jgi:hypothetical protein